MALGAPDDLTDAVPDGAPYLVSLDAIDIGVSPMAYIHDRVVDRSNATFQVKFEIHRRRFDRPDGLRLRLRLVGRRRRWFCLRWLARLRPGRRRLDRRRRGGKIDHRLDLWLDV